MRKMLLVVATVLLVAASAEAEFVISLVDHATGESYGGSGSGIYTIDVMISNPGETLGMIGGGGSVAVTPGITASNLVLNTIDFDSDLTTDNTTDPNTHFEIMTVDKGPYHRPVKIASFTLTVLNARCGDMVNFVNAFVGTEDFEAHAATVTPFSLGVPEPATALLLIGALPFLRRRDA